MRANRKYYFKQGDIIGHFPAEFREVPFRVFMKKRKGYIFTNKKHSELAIMATILGVISLAALIVVVFQSYLSAGDVAVNFGFTGLLATLFSMVGLSLGMATVREKDYYRLFPVLGILLNLVALGGVSLILYAGAKL